MATATAPRRNSKSKRKPDSLTRFRLELCRCTDGKFYPSRLVPDNSWDDDDNVAMIGGAKQRMVKFVPLNSPRRFRVVDLPWAPNRVHSERRYDPKLTKKQRHAVWKSDLKEYRARVESLGFPKSYLAVPPSVESTSWSWTGGDTPKLLTRAAAIAEAVRENSRTFPAMRVGQGAGDERWQGLIEYGAPVEIENHTVYIGMHGMGKVEIDVQYPVRIVFPTAAELAKYPTPERGD